MTAAPVSVTARAISKDAARVCAYGTVDEANSAIGVVLAQTLPDAVRDDLVAIQHQLFDLGGELCIPGHAAIFDADVDPAGNHARSLQRRLAPAQGFHPAGRWCGGGVLPRGAHQ
jgi:cob(I)alamin adenosyltransferase